MTAGPPLSRRRFLPALPFAAWASVSAIAGAPSAFAAPPRLAPYYSARGDLTAPLACARMILSAFEPEEHFPVADVEQMIFHRPGRWIFEGQLAPILLQKKYRVRLLADTPYHELLAGKSREGYGGEQGRRVDRDALSWMLPYLTPEVWSRNKPGIEEARDALQQGNLVMVGLDPRALRGTALPYCRYDVILLKMDNAQTVVHDPCGGARKVYDTALFERAFREGPDQAALVVSR